MLNADIDFKSSECRYPADLQGDVIEWIEVSVIVVAAVAFVVGFLLSVLLPPADDALVRSPLAAGPALLSHVAANRETAATRRVDGETVATGGAPSLAPGRLDAPALRR